MAAICNIRDANTLGMSHIGSSSSLVRPIGIFKGGMARFLEVCPGLQRYVYVAVNLLSSWFTLPLSSTPRCEIVLRGAVASMGAFASVAMSIRVLHRPQSVTICESRTPNRNALVASSMFGSFLEVE